MTLLSAAKRERLIPVVISLLSLQEPSALQGGPTQRKVESKASFPAKRKTRRSRHRSFTSLTAAGFVADDDTTGEHQDRAGLSMLRNCTFPLTSTSVYFQHSGRRRKEKKPAVPDPSLLSLPACVTLGREGLFWPAGSGTDTFTQPC